MKTVKSTKQPSYKDPLPNGDRVYYCPMCESNGKPIPSSQVAIVYDNLVVSKGRAKLAGKRTGRAICPECKAEFRVVGGELVLIG